MSKRKLSRLLGVSRGTGKAIAWLAMSLSAGLAGSAALDTAQAQTPRAANSAAPTAQAPASHPGKERAGIDALIDHLHDSFKITPQQESLWQDVAKVMRDNAQTLSNLAKARSEHAKTATAVDDLKSYAEISEAHATGTKRLIPVFQALYDSMSPEQKSAADAEFRDHFRAHQHHAH
jgi:protein CpxP